MSNKAVTKTDKKTPERPGENRERTVFLPRVDIRESEDKVVLIADMPGVDENSVNIDLEGSELTIRGQFVPKAPDGYSLTYEEYESGDYERTFTLGNTIDRNAIKAVVKDGVLNLTLPKAKEAQPKRITVKAG